MLKIDLKSESVETERRDWFLFNYLDNNDGRFGQRVEVELVRSNQGPYIFCGGVIRIYP